MRCGLGAQNNQENRILLKVVKRIKGNWIEHMLRVKGLLTTVSEGNVEG